MKNKCTRLNNTYNNGYLLKYINFIIFKNIIFFENFLIEFSNISGIAIQLNGLSWKTKTKIYQSI